ncbi:MAG: PHP domain-containing protein [Thermodesulfovibrionales bacterium]|nr:PHP domain-containing protein [Thermodesulfovibrionales bacterium]
MFRIDLHVHSKLSGDSDSEPEEIIERAIEIGLDGIAFTEHYSYEASEPVEVLKGKYRGDILILRGVEFSTKEGHCLIFGFDTDKHLKKYTPVEEVLTIVQSSGGIIIPSHPFRGVNSIGERIRSLRGLFAIEGYNGYNMHPYNVKAVEIAQELGIPFTGGSDAHEPHEVGQCYTEFLERVTEENFITLLKAGRYTGRDVRKISRMEFNFL